MLQESQSFRGCRWSPKRDARARSTAMSHDLESPTSPEDSLIPNPWHKIKSTNNGNISSGIYYPTTVSALKRNRSVRQGFSNYRRRVILKNGECNVIRSSIARKRLRFVLDFFTTFVDAQWRWNLIAFVLSFFISWLIFGLVWWLMAFTHGDLEEDHLPPMQESTNWQPCVLNIFGYTSCFLFSIETQHTIGYGSRVITDECPEAIFIMCLQSMFGVMIQSFMGAIMLAKMMRPRQRSSTLLFSKYAVISHRDGDLCLMFRVGDLQKSHMLGASVRAQLIKHKTTKEGELLPYYQTELELNADGCDSNLFFIWPVTMVHRITPDSPLYGVTAKDILQQRFEIVVALDGTVESTGQTTQARSSYTNGEILWAHRFVPMVAFNRDLHGFEVDYAKFDQTCQVDTPLSSAKNMDDYYHNQEKHKSIDNSESMILRIPEKTEKGEIQHKDGGDITVTL